MDNVFNIEIPKITDLEIIDKIAVQVHDCHVEWRPDIFEYTDSIIDKEELERLIDTNSVFVIKKDNIIVGYVLLSSKEGKKNGYKYRKQLEIEAMGIDKEYRNQGIGTRLLEFVKEYGKNNNYTDLRLTVNEENENAIHLYEKVGFKVRNIAYTLHFDKE